MERGHGARRNAALEPVAHHQVGTVTELLNKWQQAGEIIGIIGVTHDDVFAASGPNSAHQRVAVPLGVDVHDSGSGLPRELLRAVRAAVVGDQDFPVDPVFPHAGQGLAYAGFHGFRLV
jgi:hypothetical protein